MVDFPKTLNPYQVKKTEAEFSFSTIKMSAVNKQTIDYLTLKYEKDVLTELVKQIEQHKEKGTLHQKTSYEEALFTKSLIYSEKQITPNNIKENFLNKQAFQKTSRNQEGEVIPFDQLEMFAAEKLIILLKSILEDIALNYQEQYPEFEEFSKELTILEQSFPILSEEELKTLQDMPGSIGVTIKAVDLPRNFQIIFWDKMSKYYEEQIATANKTKLSLEEDLESQRNNMSSFEDERTILGELLNYFSSEETSPTEPNKLNAVDVSFVVGLLVSVMDFFDGLKTSQKDLFSAALQVLFNSPPYPGKPFLSVVGNCWAYFLVGSLILTKPEIQEEEIIQAIQSKIDLYKDCEIPNIKPLFDSLEYMINNKGLSSLTGDKPPLYSVDNFGLVKWQSEFMNKITTDPAYINNMTDLDISAITSAYYTMLNQSQFLVEEGRIEERTIIEKLMKVDVLKENLEIQKQQSQSESIKVLPLPSAIACVLLDHYMPREIAFLDKLTKNLYYNNTGSQLGNAILDEIIGFVNAANHYDFASFVGQPSAIGVIGYSGSVKGAFERLQREKEQIVVSLKQATGAITAIDKQKEKIEGDILLTSAEKNDLYRLLYNYRANIAVIVDTLLAMSNLLNQLEVVPVSDPTVAGKFLEGVFNVKGPENWQEVLRSMERNLISGIPSSGVSGGMTTINTRIQSDQQSFADTGQNEQLEMQMELTTMQQEWTVVATSLQILNQIYLSLARNILQ